jgi:hypothetical protein
MARMRMVTRTVEVNTYSVMTCNTETAEVRTIDFKVGVIPQSIDPMKYLKKQYETETLKLCAITSHTVETILYGMPEDEFIKNATVIPPRTTAE